MKKLMSNGEIFEADNIIKNNMDIIGLDLNDNTLFLFRGISDFSKFQLQDENGNKIEFPPLEATTEDYLVDLDFRLSMIELGL